MLHVKPTRDVSEDSVYRSSPGPILLGVDGTYRAAELNWVPRRYHQSPPGSSSFRVSRSRTPLSATRAGLETQRQIAPSSPSHSVDLGRPSSCERERRPPSPSGLRFCFTRKTISSWGTGLPDGPVAAHRHLLTSASHSLLPAVLRSTVHLFTRTCKRPRGPLCLGSQLLQAEALAALG